MKILFQGDSITDAFRKPEEINPAFQLGNGYAFLVAAKLGAQYPERSFEFINRGVSGNNLDKLAERWQQDAIDLSPDLLSLLIGVNNRIASQDGTGEPPHTGVLDCYRSLLHQMHERHPNTRFLLLEPYLLKAGNVTPAMIATLKLIQQGMATVAAEFGAPFVPLQEVFNRALSFAPPSYWAYDGIHATHAGFQLIADAWIEAAQSHDLLSLPSKISSA